MGNSRVTTTTCSLQCAALGQRHTKRTVDVRNGCTFVLLAKVIQPLLRRVRHNVSRYAGPDSTKHCRGSPCCDRTHSFAWREPRSRAACACADAEAGSHSLFDP